jgi:hypothetical protein
MTSPEQATRGPSLDSGGGTQRSAWARPCSRNRPHEGSVSPACSGMCQQIVALRRWTLVQYVRFRREDIAGADKYCARATCVWFHPTKVLFTKVCVIRKIRA